MWDVPAPEANYEPRGSDGTAVTELMERRALVQRWSAPWCVAWHVLECIDYDLNGDLAPWTPPTPFASKPHWWFWSSVPAWSRSEIVGYLDYCRQRASDHAGRHDGGQGGHAAATLPPVPRPAVRLGHHQRSWATPPSTLRRSGNSSPQLASRAVRRLDRGRHPLRRETDEPSATRTQRRPGAVAPGRRSAYGRSTSRRSTTCRTPHPCPSAGGSGHLRQYGGCVVLGHPPEEARRVPVDKQTRFYNPTRLNATRFE